MCDCRVRRGVRTVMQRSHIVSASLLVVASAAATAYTLEEQQTIDLYKKDFEKQVDQMHASCGNQLKVEYALDSEPKNMKDVTRRPAGWGYSVCGEATDALTSVCNDKAAKPVVVKKLKTLKCKFQMGTSKAVQAKGQHHFNAFTIDGTTLLLEFDHLGGNTTIETIEFIRKSY